MKRFLLQLILLTTALAAPASGQEGPDGDPMARFKPVVGDWSVRHTLWSPDGQEQVFAGTARLYFVESGTVFVVDEFDPNGQYRFIGFHAFNSTTGKYVNWTASSGVVLAWGEGEWDESREVFRTRRLDPRTGQIDPLIGRGIWTIVDQDTHVFRAIRFGPDGAEIPFKEERYTRVTK